MERKSKIVLIIFGIFIVLLGVGIVTYVLITNSLTKRGEDCVIRYLFDQDLLKNITLEHDPRNIEFDKCNFALDYVKGRAKNQLDEQMKNCTIEDKEVMTHLENLVIKTRVLTKLYKIEDVKKVRVEIKDTIEQKCNGMQNKPILLT